MAKVRLEAPYEDIVMEYPVTSPDTTDPAVRITNTKTGEVEDWYGPYAQMLGKSLSLVSEESREDLEEHQNQ